MRQWSAPSTGVSCGPQHALVGIIDELGQPGFPGVLLSQVYPLVPAASFSVYQIGSSREPRMFMSATRGVPDRTRDCWRAYLSGPYRQDRSLTGESGSKGEGIVLCHMDAGEVPMEHRVRVYEAHGLAERVSAVRREPDGALFALNLYRHLHQHPFTDSQVADFEALAPALVALVRKHVALIPARQDEQTVDYWRRRLGTFEAGLTAREADVCARLLRGMTYEGVAADLRLSLTTVKTYRNRAFDRLGIHFRNELFALLAAQPVRI
jgi:DNA-binding CsgD family transcriptional regulator